MLQRAPIRNANGHNNAGKGRLLKHMVSIRRINLWFINQFLEPESG
jgi:hypothetical protein